MPKKGTTNNPNGRPKGEPNKATSAAREAIAAFVDGNADMLKTLVRKIEDGVPLLDQEGKPVLGKDGYPLYRVDPNPEGAFKAIMSVVEYHIPKLARTEHDVSHKGGVTVTAQQHDRSL